MSYVLTAPTSKERLPTAKGAKARRMAPSHTRLRADAPPRDLVISTFERQEIGAMLRAKFKEKRACKRLNLSKPESYWLD